MLFLRTFYKSSWKHRLYQMALRRKPEGLLRIVCAELLHGSGFVKRYCLLGRSWRKASCYLCSRKGPPAFSRRARGCYAGNMGLCNCPVQEGDKLSTVTDGIRAEGGFAQTLGNAVLHSPKYGGTVPFGDNHIREGILGGGGLGSPAARHRKVTICARLAVA